MNTELLFSLFLFALLMGGITVYGYRRYARPARIFQQLGKPVTEEGPRLIQEETSGGDSSLVRLLRQIGTYVPSSQGDASTLRHTLSMAGYRSENAITVFYGI